jgi:predicted Rossmann fold nucleotide-binding protein DprA/Smf involved in DNA uptake
MLLSDDAYAIVMACSYVGLDRRSPLLPLTLKEWNALTGKMIASGSDGMMPGALLGQTAESLQRELQLSVEEAQRLAALLDRAGAVGVALQQLEEQGIWIVTLADENYPRRLKEKLKSHAPVVLFGAGPLALAGRNGVAIVGSRAVSENDAAGKFTENVAELCARDKLNVVSGGAKGVDIISMRTALQRDGKAIGVMSDSLAKRILEREARVYINDERLLLLSPFHPDAGFQVANAMSRNKVIYALADYAVVISSGFEKGGTWAGAMENLRQKYSPLFVRAGDEVPEGNRKLLEKGGLPLDLKDPRLSTVGWEEFLAQRSLPEEVLKKGADRQFDLFAKG